MNTNHGHVWETCKKEDGTDCGQPYGCILCNLSVCAVCVAAEGTLPSECPGKKISDADQQLIYTGTLDFVGGQWINRPYHEWETKVRAGHPRDQENLDKLNAKQPEVRDAVARLNAERQQAA